MISKGFLWLDKQIAPRFPAKPTTHLKWSFWAHAWGSIAFRDKDAPVCEFEVDPSPAIEFFGLEWPVDVRRMKMGMNPLGNSTGIYRHGTTEEDQTVWFGEEHRVVIANCLDAQSASAVLWHELTHAYQAELAGSHEFAQAAYDVSLAKSNPKSWRSYAETRFERPAFSNMNRHFYAPLTRAR